MDSDRLGHRQLRLRRHSKSSLVQSLAASSRHSRRLAPIFWLPLWLLVTLAGAAEDGSPFRRDLFPALDEANADPVKPLVLLFVTESCYWCHRLETDATGHAGLRTALTQAVGVRVDAAVQPVLTARLGIDGFPTILLINRKREIIKVLKGYLPPDDLATAIRVLVLRGDASAGIPADLAARATVATAGGDPARLIALVGAGDGESRRQVRGLLVARGLADDGLWKLLAHERLTVRVDAAAIIAAVAGPPASYDPFASAADRVRLAEAWKTSAAGAAKGGVIP